MMTMDASPLPDRPLRRRGPPPREVAIRGGLCLLHDEGLVAADLVCCDGVISEICAPSDRWGANVIDAAGCLVLPGIVDIHGDAFERQIMPRPGTTFPLEIAMLETDRQLVSNGITTAYHGVTVSWEPGLRGIEQARRIIAAIDRLEAEFKADHRIQLRWETFALDATGEIAGLFGRRKKPMLAFNDHTTPSLAGNREAGKIGKAAERAGMTVQDYRVLLARVSERKTEVLLAVRELGTAARHHGVHMLSHDDHTAEMRRDYRGLGVTIAEFPMNWETLQEAAADGDDIVLGSPNVVRGGSHNGAITAENAITRGLCTVLASDYYYPAPINAAMSLVDRAVLPIGKAWDLVSAAPARACGLLDRGRIACGLRADLVVVPLGKQRPVMTLVEGRSVYSGL